MVKHLLAALCLLLAFTLSACSTPIPLHSTVNSPLPASVIEISEMPGEEETPEPSYDPNESLAWEYTPAPSTGELMVWQSRTGTKYHSIPDCGKMNPANAIHITLEQAKARGLTPCSLCDPPK